DVDHGLAGPHHRRDGLGDGAAAVDDGVEPALAGVVLADAVRPDEAGPRPRRELLGRPPEPVDAVIRAARPPGVALPDAPHVAGPELLLHLVLRLERRVAEDQLG